MRTDLKRDLPCYAAERGRFTVVDVPPLTHLAVDGRGDPNTSPEYARALGALYPLAYALRFLSRDELGRDHVVSPLEALWWSRDMAAFTTRRDAAQWEWTLLVVVPDWIEPAHVDAARAVVARRRNAPDVGAVRCERSEEGSSVQTLHVGPYADEGPVLAALHGEFLPAHGLRPTGRHHEIYLSDARRTAPERLRTILRQPVSKQPVSKQQVSKQPVSKQPVSRQPVADSSAAT